jgi:hypothetical protein
MAGEDSTTTDDVTAHVVPSQPQGRHDAYDIYAEIFALRIEDKSSAS